MYRTASDTSLTFSHTHQCTHTHARTHRYKSYIQLTRQRLMLFVVHCLIHFVFHSYYVFIPGVLPPTSKTYKNDYACIWKFPSPGACKRYHIKIDWMNLKGAESCKCADHVLLNHSVDQEKCLTCKSVGTE